MIAEARSSRVILSAAIIFCLGLAIAIFLGEIAITETRQTQAGIAAGFFRLAILFFLSLFTINSIVRDMNDRMLLLYLSLPISRSVFIIGKFLGFATLGVTFALIATLIMANFANPETVMLWGFSLALESFLLIGFSLLCAFSFGQITLAFASVAGIYLLSRTLTAILLMASNPLRGTQELLSQKFINGILSIMDYLLPRMDRFTRSDWLMYEHIETGEIIFVMQQTVVYLALLLAAACFDFYRKNF